ncbi:MAG: hypothetical protein B7Y56_03755 [Gallionellales bacterium 35-53-114]|jgi:hypothetical protein|nr:MAG: hypothetical protein B7Y56_03755 [Gallionellales bacterium 35-53-114]OYZ65215.1 MAG: hypothetical protein B7Y04_00915 [Gallionellales bacterium 24-53-125]OZB08121.1 MAG: hypothetical protein B7X61_11365 [Gallionellales bacterium 39-52-133]HQS58043.1 MAE_28990/MAE_18760 family HEPN-like nuclease [Gallionellaceae bacterium]HQS73599.1 MAE_28990/MAE_18760 family HEPN-like nuclease [Gallionellaceae bacterium]
MHRVIEEIIDSNEWRDGDFAKLKVNSSRVDESLWCRMCIPIIYAHWEGFVASSLKIMIDHLNDMKLSTEKIPTRLVVVGLSDTYRTLSGKQSFEQRLEFTNKFRSLIKETIKFRNKIDTKSNLKSNVLNELCQMFGFEFENFNGIIGDIDRLVHVRNSIAHGENSMKPDMNNVQKYIEAVTQAMDILIGEINNFLINEDYLLKTNINEPQIS